jgi:hypothetical protein
LLNQSISTSGENWSIFPLFFAQFTIQPGSPLKFLGAQVQVNMHVPKQVEAFWVTSSPMVGLWMTL